MKILWISWIHSLINNKNFRYILLKSAFIISSIIAKILFTNCLYLFLFFIIPFDPMKIYFHSVTLLSSITTMTVCCHFHLSSCFYLWFIFMTFFLFISQFLKNFLPVTPENKKSRSWNNFNNFGLDWQLTKYIFGHLKNSLLNHYRMISFSQWTHPAYPMPQVPNPIWN